jgi:hypothetical protein
MKFTWLNFKQCDTVSIFIFEKHAQSALSKTIKMCSKQNVEHGGRGMNKNYRNALLLAAISSLAACAGDTAQTEGDGQSPLMGDFDPTILANGDDAAKLAHQEIASLLASVFQTILGATSEVSKTSYLMADDESGIGSVVSGALESSDSVSGISIKPGNQPCTDGGTFSINATYEYINGEGQAGTPEDFSTFGEYEVTTSISTTYTACNEPARAGYNADNTPIFKLGDDGENVPRIVDGTFGLAFNSNPIQGSNGTNGFEFTADLQLANYSIQEGDDAARLMDANIAFTLKTEDANGETYMSTISGDIVSQNEDGQSFTKTTLLADGELEMDLDTYELFLDGSIVDYSMLSNPFSFYSESTLVRAPGTAVVDGTPVPSSGILVIEQGGMKGTATINSDGTVDLETTDGDGTTKSETKTWTELLNNI